ncbi:TDRD5 protein, partial [Upupa epops]|nr:TDRD5 protein [Upupa epops]
MSEPAQRMEVLKKEVRSLLIAAKEGLTPSELEQEYLAMIGRPLPLHELGFQSALELVAGLPDVVSISPWKNGTVILKDFLSIEAIADETTKEIAKLVARQKSAGTRKKSAAVRAGAAAPSGRGRAPTLPVLVKTELQDLLSSSPVLLSDFAKAFFRRFGRDFQYTQYGFSSLTEVLSSVSDMVAVKRTRAGSLLTLKCMPSETQKEEAPRAPAVEVPPLEPSFDTESVHSLPEEVGEPVEVQAVTLADSTEQPQDLEQSLLEKLVLAAEIPPDAVQDGSLRGLPPLERRCMVGVFVGFIISPGQFYIHVCTRETDDELLELMIEMRRCYSDGHVCERYAMPEASVRPGQLCCVVTANWWYRAVIHRAAGDQEVEVFYADYGNLEIVHTSRLRFLKWCYLQLPAQAIPCSLAGVKPAEGTWSRAATLLFEDLCGSNLLVGIVDEYVNGVLHLLLCDTSKENDVYFHRVLSDGGHACICEENVPSQGFTELNPVALYIQPS